MTVLVAALVAALCLTTVTTARATPRWTAALSPRQYYFPDPDDPKPSFEKCVDVSLTSPRWGIFSPSLVTVDGYNGGSKGDIRFIAVNQATGMVANCSAHDIELDPVGDEAWQVWHACEIPELHFQFNLSTFDMRLRGSWRCGESDRFNFSGSGLWDPPLIQGCFDDWDVPRGNERLCIMGNSQVSVGLTSPVAIHPQLPILPFTPSERAYRCVDRSWDPEWQVNDIDYQHHVEQVGADEKRYYNLTLNITNLSNNEELVCSATASLDAGSAPEDGTTPWALCTPSASSAGIARTSVTLDTTYGILGIKQDWSCTDGILGIDESEFTGIAYLETNLSCTDSSLPAYTCTLPSPTTFSGYSYDPPRFPHTSYSKSCTVGSLVNTTSMTLRDYSIEAAAAGSSALRGTFTLVNPGPGDTYKLSGMPVVDDGTWHACQRGAGEDDTIPWQLALCQYLLDRKEEKVAFRVQWYCDDRDPSHAILFDATVQGRLDAAANVAMPVSSFKWTSSTGPMVRGPTLPWV